MREETPNKFKPHYTDHRGEQKSHAEPQKPAQVTNYVKSIRQSNHPYKRLDNRENENIKYQVKKKKNS